MLRQLDLGIFLDNYQLWKYNIISIRKLRAVG